MEESFAGLKGSKAVFSNPSVTPNEMFYWDMQWLHIQWIQHCRQYLAEAVVHELQYVDSYCLFCRVATDTCSKAITAGTQVRVHMPDLIIAKCR